MFDAPALKARMAEKGLSQRKLAEAIGLSEKALIGKMKSGSFWIREVDRICEILEIRDPRPIFFGR